jgi:hypothetical protein
MAKIVIQIEYSSDGTVKVTGNIENKGLAYGALESARDAICDFHRSQGGSPISVSGLGAIDVGKHGT